MNENIIPKNNPRTEFQFFDEGFKIIEDKRKETPTFMLILIYSPLN
jgi:hypothetical protein